jgi:hypothetical protein
MRREKWISWEIRRVIERYATEGPGKLATELSRSESSIMGLARRLGLRSATRRLRQAETRRRKNADQHA